MAHLPPRRVPISPVEIGRLGLGFGRDGRIASVTPGIPVENRLFPGDRILRVEELPAETADQRLFISKRLIEPVEGARQLSLEVEH